MAAHSTYRLLFVLALGAVGCAPEVPKGEERARALFATCASCHGEDGGDREAYGAPAIAGLDAWYVRAQLEKFQRGVRGAHPDDAAGLRMRPMSRTLRTPEDVALISEFVAQLAPKEHTNAALGDESRGQTLYATCSTCHGPEAQGSEDKQAPPLRRASSWYLVKQLENFKAGIRGAHPDDQTGAQMRAMALGLSDEQAMRDVVTYIAGMAK